MLILVLASICILSDAARYSRCRDLDMNCAVWVARNFTECFETELVQKNCPRSCQTCDEELNPEFDLRRVPKSLIPIAWLLGKWRSEFGGKAFFPTIPKFTYGEQLEFRLSENNITRGPPTFNYTAFAWDINEPDDLIEIHSENGYIAINEDEDGQQIVSMTTAMSNGFMTVEEGVPGINQLRLHLKRIGRVHFSHDAAVRSMFREWTMLDEHRLESRLLMTTTITRKMMEHTRIVYKKIYP